MPITRWDPFRDMFSLQQRMNSLVQQAFPARQESDDPLATTNFIPPAEIYEDERHLTVKLDTPGIKHEDLDVRVENNVLTVRGERKFDKEEKEENFHRVEHHYGSFYRAFTLPATIDSGRVKADYENGVLKLTFDKREEAKPKQIKINVGSGKQVDSSKLPAAGSEKKIA